MDKDPFKKQLPVGGVLAGAIILLLAVGSNVYAQNSKKVGQLNFQVPEDWPVEKRGGLLTPVPTEEYVTIKFKEIEKEFQVMRDELSEKFSKLESDLKNTEEDLLKEIRKSQSQSGMQSGSSGDLTEILSSLELVKSELARLDRKITNKVKEMQLTFEEIRPRLEFIEENLNGLQTQIYRLDEKVDYLEEGRSSSY